MTIEIFTATVSVANLLISGYLAYGLFADQIKPLHSQKTQVKSSSDLLRPFSKAAKKKAPKVNDDGAAWMKENDLERRN